MRSAGDGPWGGEQEPRDDTAITAAFLSALRLADFEGERPFERLFGRRAPVEIEIGSGKGRFILRSAALLPGSDFVGVERALRFFRVAATRADRLRLPNVRLIRTEAGWFLARLVPEASLRAIHVLFPDPWPKKRHHKRRLFNAEFIAAVERALEDGGALNVATDHEDYFRRIEEVVGCCPGLRRSEEFLIADRQPAGETGMTNYEVKYRAGGRTILRATWVRRPRASMRAPEPGPGVTILRPDG